MYRAFFEMIGAFGLWAFAGFKGKYEDRLRKVPNYSNAIFGMIFSLVIVALIVLLVRLL